MDKTNKCGNCTNFGTVCGERFCLLFAHQVNADTPARCLYYQERTDGKYGSGLALKEGQSEVKK